MLPPRDPAALECKSDALGVSVFYYGFCAVAERQCRSYRGASSGAGSIREWLHMRNVLRSLSFVWIGCMCTLVAQSAAALTYYDVDHFAVPTNATMLIYAPATGALVLKNSQSAIVAIDVASRQATTRFANLRFTDMTLSPSGRYVFGADYGGENIGYGTPANTSYVHRLDLTDMSWDIRTAYIAGNVQAFSDTQVLLKSLDQWVTFTNDAWGSGTALVPLNTPTLGFGPGYYASVYFGDFRFDVRTGRLLHGNSAESSQEIQSFRIVNNEFVKQEGSGIYGSAQGYGGSVVLATDGSAFYYGALQVDPLDVTHNLRAYPEVIHAANASIALGDGKFYDAHTGALLGSLPFSTTVYAMNNSGDDFWAFNAATTTVHHFALQPGAPRLASAVSRKVHGSAGTFDLPLSAVTTNPTTEPRHGPAQTIVLTFEQAISAATVSIVEGIATPSAPTFAGNDVIVNLTGVANMQYVTVSLTNVESTEGGTGGSASVRIGFLLGDVNQNRVVSLADLALVNAQLAQLVTATNYLHDVNASGTLTLADKAITNANLATALPAP